MAPRVPYLSFWPRAVPLSASADLCSRYSVRGNKVNAATPDVLNITELLNRVDNDHELVSELFFIFKSVFPSHLQRLSHAVAKELPKQVEAESHTLKGMLFNLSAARAAVLAADLENLGRAKEESPVCERPLPNFSAKPKLCCYRRNPSSFNHENSHRR
jgi:HPt (histidine-containing phosphotransfer) domain-containing protein